MCCYSNSEVLTFEIYVTCSTPSNAVLITKSKGLTKFFENFMKKANIRLFSFSSIHDFEGKIIQPIHFLFVDEVENIKQIVELSKRFV